MSEVDVSTDFGIFVFARECELCRTLFCYRTMLPKTKELPFVLPARSSRDARLLLCVDVVCAPLEKERRMKRGYQYRETRVGKKCSTYN